MYMDRPRTRNAEYGLCRKMEITHEAPSTPKRVLVMRQEESTVDRGDEEEPATLLLFWSVGRHKPVSKYGVGERTALRIRAKVRTWAGGRQNGTTDSRHCGIGTGFVVQSID